ncbi:MAG: hypothetical protein QXI16_06870, partial [Sulfolobaceae archaeon]
LLLFSLANAQSFPLSYDNITGTLNVPNNMTAGTNVISVSNLSDNGVALSSAILQFQVNNDYFTAITNNGNASISYPFQEGNYSIAISWDNILLGTANISVSEGLLQSQIDALNTTLANQSTDLNTSVSNLQSQINALSNQSTALNASLSALNATLSNQSAVFNTSLAIQNATLTDLNASINNLSNFVLGINSSLTGFSNSINTTLSSLNTSIFNQGSLINNQSSLINALSSSLNSTVGQLNNLSSYANSAINYIENTQLPNAQMALNETAKSLQNGINNADITGEVGIVLAIVAIALFLIYRKKQPKEETNKTSEDEANKEMAINLIKKEQKNKEDYERELEQRRENIEEIKESTNFDTIRKQKKYKELEKKLNDAYNKATKSGINVEKVDLPEYKELIAYLEANGVDLKAEAISKLKAEKERLLKEKQTPDIAKRLAEIDEQIKKLSG